MTSTTTPPTTELTPSYRLAGAVTALALPVGWLQLWLGLGVGLFGLFLLGQTLTLRLRFTPDALGVYRGDTEIRHFPYTQWYYWEIFWQPLPILFYFREVSSIHFLPILFNPDQLRDCLERHCPNPPTSTEA